MNCLSIFTYLYRELCGWTSNDGLDELGDGDGSQSVLSPRSQRADSTALGLTIDTYGA